MDIRSARRWQTLGEAKRLLAEVDTWVQQRIDRDVDSEGYRGRYQTQLDTISNEVRAAAERIRSIVTDDPVEARPTGQVFADYNVHDQRLIWVRYAWGYFREKLDQRDDPNLRPVLEAADEVSWTSFCTLFRSALVTVPPAPIPYIEYDYIPSAVRPAQGHLALRRKPTDEGPLRDYFAALPVPLLRLPPTVVTAPWLLALICHEVGHLLQAHIEPGGAFFNTFAEMIAETVKSAGGSSEDERSWKAWSQEIFADLCMAVVAGPWSLWAISTWVLNDAARMKAPQQYYPPPELRLRLLDAFARAAQLPSSTRVFERLSILGHPHPIVDAVGQLAAKRLTINHRSRTIADFLGAKAEIFSQNGRIAGWSSSLLDSKTPKGVAAVNDKLAARDAAVAAVHAHFASLDSDEDLLDRLSSNAVSLMRRCHDSGVRAGAGEIAPHVSLTDCVFNAPDEVLFPVDLARAAANMV